MFSFLVFPLYKMDLITYWKISEIMSEKKKNPLPLIRVILSVRDTAVKTSRSDVFKLRLFFFGLLRAEPAA